MIKTKDLQEASKLIEEFKPKVTFFESNILVPGVADRLKYISSIFEMFQELCRDDLIAIQIDAALRSLVDPRLYELGVPEPQVGVQYLNTVSEMCERDFIEPIRRLLEEYPLEETKRSIEATTNFLNSASNCMQPVVGTKDLLFQFTLRSFLNVKQLATGQVVLTPPVELSMVLAPFQTRLDELVNVARLTIESIKIWGDEISKQKTKHVEIIVYLSQVKAAEEQARAAKYSVIFQIAVIVFTVVLILGANRANLYFEKRDLEQSVTKLNGSLNSCRAGTK